MVLAIALEIDHFMVMDDDDCVPVLVSTGIRNADAHRQSIGGTILWKTTATQ
jgi:hypothetical protein